MALTWHERDLGKRREPIDWVGIYVWSLLGASVLLALAMGMLVGR